MFLFLVEAREGAEGDFVYIFLARASSMSIKSTSGHADSVSRAGGATGRANLSLFLSVGVEREREPPGVRRQERKRLIESIRLVSRREFDDKSANG